MVRQASPTRQETSLILMKGKWDASKLAAVPGGVCISKVQDKELEKTAARRGDGVQGTHHILLTSQSFRPSMQAESRPIDQPQKVGKRKPDLQSADPFVQILRTFEAQQAGRQNSKSMILCIMHELACQIDGEVTVAKR